MSWKAACSYAVSDGVPRRSLWVALVVGTILNLINQGDALLAEQRLQYRQARADLRRAVSRMHLWRGVVPDACDAAEMTPAYTTQACSVAGLAHWTVLPLNIV